MLKICSTSQDKTTKPITSVAEAIAHLPTDGRLRTKFNENQAEMTVLLKSWIVAGWAECVPSFGAMVSKLQMRRYDDGNQLLQALVGDFDSAKNLGTEKQLALEVKASALIGGRVAEALRAVFDRINSLNDKAKVKKILDELRYHRGAYWAYYSIVKSGLFPEKLNIVTYIQAPDSKPSSIVFNVTLLHDIMEYFITRHEFTYNAETGETKAVEKNRPTPLTTGSEMIFDDPQQELATVSGELPGSNNGLATQARLQENYRNTLAAANESQPFTQSARLHEMPMWASHSWTTLRMLQLVKWANGGDKNLHAWLAQRAPLSLRKLIEDPRANALAVKAELLQYARDIAGMGLENTDQYEAVAWAIFAFWNETLLQYVHPIHRFHEVMDIASNFGVAYETFKYPTHAPGAPRSRM